MKAPRRSAIAFWALAALALLASHDLVWLAQVGRGEELARTLRSAGHGYWEAASLAIGAVGLAVGLGVVLRLTVLRSEATAVGARRATLPPGLRSRTVRVWSRLFAIVALGFVVQENVEHLGQHGHLIGVGALVGPEYPLALPVIGLITAVAAVLATVVSGTATALETVIAAALAALRRPPRRLVRAPLRRVLARSPILAGSSAERAPPSSMLPSIG